MKVMVKWGFTDDYGRARKEFATIEWFETLEEANNWMAKMREGNGGYFKVWEVKQADYKKYCEMVELMKKVAELEKLF